MGFKKNPCLRIHSLILERKREGWEGEREREREMERRERNTDTKEKHRLVASPPRIEPVGRWSSLPSHTGQGKQEVS